MIFHKCCFVFLCIILCVCNGDQSLSLKAGAVSEEERRSYVPPVIQFEVFNPEDVFLSKTVFAYDFEIGGVPAKSVTKNVPVYVSMTSIGKRSNGCLHMITSLLTGTIVPTHIYLFLSSDHYLIDSGVTPEELSPELKLLAKTYKEYFSIVFTGNIGPHRKLLPLLAEKWLEKCIIITVDDDTNEELATLGEQVSKLLSVYMSVYVHMYVCIVPARGGT